MLDECDTRNAGFKTVAGAASCSWVGSTPTHSRQLNGLLDGRSVLAQRWFRYSCLRSFYGSCCENAFDLGAKPVGDRPPSPCVS